MVTTESVKQGIEAGLACEHVEVIGDGQHFQAVIVSKEFESRSRVQRHQLVYAALGERMRGEIHALPPRWQQVSHANPFFYMVDGFRYGFFGVSDFPPGASLAIVAASFVSVAALGLWLLKTGYKLRT